MNFVSTRGRSPAVSFSEAIATGLAPDGGLYVPERLPLFSADEIRALAAVPESGSRFAELAACVLRPFFEGDRLASELGGICNAALDFPVPLRKIDPHPSNIALLELFHGPTCAFKDVGARFLAECLTRLGSRGTVLVATSGDTGGAVAAAFHGRPGIEVLILFPKGMVSSRQEKQLTCWGGNVRALAVRGSFDDCQRLVKETLAEAHADPKLARQWPLLSANSINVGRLLPQMAYFALASLRFHGLQGRTPGIIVPSGNLGNAMAALYAKRLGFPIREVVLATNANTTVRDYFETGRYVPRPTIQTLANAMDVGNPSNMERLLQLAPDLGALRREVRVHSVSDTEIQEAIRDANERWGETLCPHTATGFHARERLGGSDWIIAATAHPAKFETIVEPLVGRAIAVPAELQKLLDGTSDCVEIEPAPGALRLYLDSRRKPNA